MSVALLPPVRLTDKTAQEFLDDAVARIPLITDRWTDFNAADLGMVQITVLASLLEDLLFELDNRAAETTIIYARQRKNVARLVRLIGYFLKRKTASTTTVRFEAAAPATVPVPIYPDRDSRVTQVQTRSAQPLTFVPLAFHTIPLGSRSVLVPAIQGRRKVENFTPTTQPDQFFTLTSDSVAEGTIMVSINNQFWAPVKHWIESYPDSLHFQIQTDEEGSVRVVFGDGISGKIPLGTVQVIYVETVGLGGNLAGRDRITFITLPPLDANGNPLPFVVSVTNVDPASGGANEETAFHAKKQYPGEYSAQERAVTELDIVSKAEGYPGVRQAGFVDIRKYGPFDSIPAGLDYFQVRIPLVPAGNVVLPSAALKLGVQKYLEEMVDVAVDITVIDPIFLPVNVSVDLYMRRGYTESAVKSAVQGAIIAFFTPAEQPEAELRLTGAIEGQAIGRPVSFGQLLAAIQEVEGVAAVAAINPAADVQVAPEELAILSSGSPVVNVLGTA